MFLFDTYAIIEIIQGNYNYKSYINEDIIINNFILAELSYWLIRNYGHEIARRYVKKYETYKKEVNSEIILEAMQFRYDNKKQKMSMTDCIGYIMAKKLGIKFLTGDKEFEKMENVEFVKNQRFLNASKTEGFLSVKK